MKIEMNILNKSRNKNFLILLFMIIVSSCGNRNDKYLKEAILWDAVVCPLIHAKDSNSILIYYSAQNLVDEFETYPNIANAEKYLYESIKNHSSIQVSDTFYNAMHKFRVCADSLMDEVYMVYDVGGLLEKYFKKEKLFGGVLILKNQEEGFLVKGEQPYPAFGLEHNIGYMAYLLSKQNIYLNYVWIDHILMIIINEELSNMSELKIE